MGLDTLENSSAAVAVAAAVVAPLGGRDGGRGEGWEEGREGFPKKKKKKSHDKIGLKTTHKLFFSEATLVSFFPHDTLCLGLLFSYP